MVIDGYKNSFVSTSVAVVTFTNVFSGYLCDNICLSNGVAFSFIESKPLFYENTSVKTYVNDNVNRSLPIKISSEARTFLDNNKHIETYISQICYMLGEEFEGCMVSAELIDNFDENGSILKLNVIDEGRSIDIMLDKLDRFEDRWWLDSEAYRCGRILVDVMAI